MHELEMNLRALSEHERRFLARLLERPHVHDPNAAFDQQMTLGQRVADRVAAFGGSWTFIGMFLLVMAVWIALNAARVATFDPFPFILLNLLLSCLAALQAPVIMMSQNRQAVKDRYDAKVDYEVNVRAEMEISHLKEKLDVRDAEIAELIDINRRQLVLLERLSERAAQG
jgi:uncharacterized membrane protein